MQRIQSLICFNGGSAGDLLKALCLLTWNLDLSIVKQPGRIDFNSQYFKMFCEDIWNKKYCIDDIDWNLVCPVENSHYYLPFYKEVAEKLYYINYNDSANCVILKEYLRKRHNNDWAHFLDRHIESIPVELQHHINHDNCQRVFEIQWIKNLKSWRSNTNLMPIEFVDMLDRNRMLDLVQTITDKKLHNTDMFDNIYQNWKDNNSVLVELII